LSSSIALSLSKSLSNAFLFMDFRTLCAQWSAATPLQSTICTLFPVQRRGGVLFSCPNARHSFTLLAPSLQPASPTSLPRASAKSHESPVTLFVFSFFSSTYELPNLQVLCPDNDPTVPGVGGGRLLLSALRFLHSAFCLLLSPFCPLLSAFCFAL
jgi:hypothetical protein